MRFSADALFSDSLLGLPITHKSCLSFFVFNVQAYFNNFEKIVKATTYTKAGAFRRRLG